MKVLVTATGKAHEIGIEINVGCRMLGASSVSREGVLVACPFSIGDVASNAADYERGKFSCCSVNALAKFR